MHPDRRRAGRRIRKQRRYWAAYADAIVKLGRAAVIANDARAALVAEYVRAATQPHPLCPVETDHSAHVGILAVTGGEELRQHRIWCAGRAPAPATARRDDS